MKAPTSWWVSLALTVAMQVAAVSAGYGALTYRVDMTERTLSETRQELAAYRSLSTDLAVLKSELSAINKSLVRLESAFRIRPDVP